MIPQVLHPPGASIDRALPPPFVTRVGPQVAGHFMAGEHVKATAHEGVRDGKDGPLLATADGEALGEGGERGALVRTAAGARWVRIARRGRWPFRVGSCWIPGSCIPYTELKCLILKGFFQRSDTDRDPRGKPVKTTCYDKFDQLRPWNPI